MLHDGCKASFANLAPFALEYVPLSSSSPLLLSPSSSLQVSGGSRILLFYECLPDLTASFCPNQVPIRPPRL